MALKNILARLASELGGDLSSQRAYWQDKVNLAARDIYNEFEFPEALKEAVFEIPTDTSVISLPSFVEDIRAVRDIESKEVLTLRDRVPYYQSSGFEKTKYDWRILDRSKPTKTSWTLDSPLTFRAKVPTEKPFAITIIGKTYKASRTTSIVTFLAGDTEKTTNDVFEAGEIYVIRKSGVTDVDLDVLASDGSVIAEIPNNEISPSYYVIQVKDWEQQEASETRLIEILYKETFVPLNEDADRFLGTDVYDDAIMWNALAFIWAKNSEDAGIMTKVQLCASKSRFCVNQILNSMQAGKSYRMDFGKNRYNQIFNSMY